MINTYVLTARQAAHVASAEAELTAALETLREAQAAVERAATVAEFASEYYADARDVFDPRKRGFDPEYKR